MTISSRTPDGMPNRCPLCGKSACVEPSQPTGDAPCPNCGHLLWFLCNRLGTKAEQISRLTSFVDDLGADSLDLVEFVMELEAEFGVTIPDDQVEQIKTIGDAIDAIERLRKDHPGQEFLGE